MDRYADPHQLRRPYNMYDYRGQPDPYADHIRQLYTYLPVDGFKSLYRAEPDRTGNDGVYMFIKFPAENDTSVTVVRQAVVMAQRTVHNMGGRFVGLARRVWEMGNTDGKTEAMVVYWFRSVENARTFLWSDERMKQHDFPAPAGVCEAWALVRFYSPPNELAYNTFMLSEVRLKPGTKYEEYKERFAKPFAQLLLENDAQPFVVQSVGAEMLRRYYVPHDTIITIHLFFEPAHLTYLQGTEKWIEISEAQREMAHERCSVFTINPKACP